MDKIGSRIRIKRNNKNIKLKDLAQKVGVTASFLSQIEKGKTFPSIVTLKLVANELSTTVGDLIGENDTLLNNPIMKIEDRKIARVIDNGTELLLLSNHDETKKMETFYMKIKEHGDSDNIMIKHSGEEFCFIQSGKVELLLDNKAYTLKKGDSAYFNSNIEHKIKNINKGISEILWIVTPPNI